MRNLLYIIAAIVALALGGCIEDGYTTSPADQPEFSIDTLKMGTFFTEDVTPTFSFVVYNRHDKLLSISSIALRGSGREGVYRLNVDGFSGREFHNIDIRPRDSIFVFVEATIPPVGAPQLGDYFEHLDFVTNGVTTTVVLHSVGRDVERLRGLVIDRDTRWSADHPRRIFDSLVVSPGVTLTLDPGVELYFHDKARLNVHGTLRSLGTPEQPVIFSGDRTDNVVGQIPFDLMASQWRGVYFSPSSRASYMSHTVVKNTERGVVVDSVAPHEAPALTLVNCRLRNSAGCSLAAVHSDITAIGTEIADAGGPVAYFHGGNIKLNHCTLANYYLFTAITEPTLTLGHFSADTADGSQMPLMTAEIDNTIIYGLGTDLSHGDFTDTAVTLRRCILKSAGEDDANFIGCLWDTDPLYYTVREDYLFDYRPQPASPAIGAAWPDLTLPEAAFDFYGTPRTTPSIGAFEPKP